jgi:hypothetical protein
LGDPGGSGGGHRRSAHDDGEQQRHGQREAQVRARKLMSTAWAFWMMKISTTTRPAKPAIRPVRMLRVVQGTLQDPVALAAVLAIPGISPTV